MNKKFRTFIWILIGLFGLGIITLWLTPYFSGLKEVNPVLLQIGSLSIHWYGLLIAIGVLVGLWWIEKRASQTTLSRHICNLSILAVVSGIIGARILFVVLKWSEFSSNWLNIINLQNGGLSIHGAILGGIIAILIYAKIHKLPILKILDIFVPALLLGQAIGRFGNFFNQEAFGAPTNLPWKMFIKEEFRPVGLENFEFFHPTFLYSIISLLVILIIILLLERKKMFDGAITLAYFSFYSVMRFVIEFFRIDNDHWGLLTVAQWGSLIIIIVALIVLILRYSSKKRLH